MAAGGSRALVVSMLLAVGAPGGFTTPAQTTASERSAGSSEGLLQEQPRAAAAVSTRAPGPIHGFPGKSTPAEVRLAGPGSRLDPAIQEPKTTGDEASSQPAPPVETLVALALERAPSLAAQRARLGAARAAVSAAGAFPDPMVEFEYRAAGFPRYTIGTDPMSMAGASVRVPLLSRGRRRASRSVAEAEVRVREASTGAVSRSLVAEVRSQYARLYALDREAETLDDAEEVADMLATTAEARYAAGGADQATILRAQLERTRLDERRADLRAERAVVVATLNRLLYRPAGTPIGRVASLPETAALPIDTATVAAAAARQAPDIAVLEAEFQVADRRVAASREELRPSWSVGTGLFWQGGADRVVNFSVGVELPFWKKSKQLPLIAAAELEREAARLVLEDARAEAQAEAERLLAEWKNATEQLVRYREAIIPQSSAALDAARAGYLGEREDFPGVLEEFRRWIEIRVEVARREAARFTALARLEALVSGRADAGTLAGPGPNRDAGANGRKEPQASTSEKEFRS